MMPIETTPRALDPGKKRAAYQRLHHLTTTASFPTTVRGAIAKPRGETDSRRMFKSVARQGRSERNAEAYFPVR